MFPAIAAVAFLVLWFLNAALLHLPVLVSHVLVALALASAAIFTWKQARRRRRPPER